MKVQLHAVKQTALALAALVLLIGLLIGALNWVDWRPGIVAKTVAAMASTGGPAQTPDSPTSARPLATPVWDGARKVLAGLGPEQTVRRAWKLARDAAAYRFATDLTQVTYPARLLSNAGRGPQEQFAHLEGELDVRTSTLRLRLWQGAGSVLSPANSLEARIEKDRAFVRSDGGAWREEEDFSGSFAPGSDLLAYLVAMKNVQVVPAAEKASTSSVSRFAFDVDGPAFAAYMRDQLQRQLRAKGELPMELTLDAPALYRNMTGTGEVWIDNRGLPLRLAVHLIYPEQTDGSHVEADIRSDFSGYPTEIAAKPSLLQKPAAWAGHAAGAAAGLLQAASHPSSDWGKTAGTGGTLACALLLVGVLVTSRRSRRLYAAIVVAVIASMVVMPILQSERAVAFFERQRAAQDRQVQEQKAEQVALDFAASQRSWDAHRDPLASQPGAGVAHPLPAPLAAEDAQTPNGRSPLATVPQLPLEGAATSTQGDTCNQNDTTDPDGDGLSNYDECIMATNRGEPDTDQDGLNDGMEADRLGTGPTLTDTDGDSISDRMEVQGFSYKGQQWYLDPARADTNADGLIDPVECPPLADGTAITPDVIRDQCDADRDGVPDLFDDDNDNDGVPDRADYSPNDVLDRSAISHDGALLNAQAAYDGAHPFQLLVSNLIPGYPSFVDLQIKPVNPEHLTYALNVVDWPAGDDEGQIQHVKDTTFATSDNPDIKQPDDETGQYGDLRLVPLMEIEMTGDGVPLKLSTPAVTVTVRGELSATVSLTQRAANASSSDVKFRFEDAATHKVEFFEGGCEAKGASLGTFNGVTNGSQGILMAPRLTNLADAEHAIEITWGDNKTECTAIPNLINGPYDDNMVDLTVLEPYGIGMLEGDEQPGGGRTLLAYVPLNLVPDETNGGRTAFAARMVYWPGAANPWTAAEHVRVKWVLQMLTDECDDTEFDLSEEYQKEHPEDYDEQLKTWCEQAANRTMDHLQIVHEYDESYFVTGLVVSEDHGLDTAIAYLDPKAYPADDQNLWELSWGLGQMFLPGRNCETDATLVTDGDPNSCHTDAQRDLTIFETDSAGTRVGNSSIAGRFDHADRNGNGVRDNEDYAKAKGWNAERQADLRWSVPADALYVETMRFPHEDYLAYLSSGVVPRILKQFSPSVSPTLLIASEHRYRSAGLAAATLANGVLTVDTNPQSHKEQTDTGLIWGPYRYDQTLDPITNNVVGWEPYSIEEYYGKLGDALQKRFDANFPADLGATNEGKVAVARGYYMTLLAGLSSQVCASGVDCLVEEGESDEELIASAEELGDKIAEVAGDLVLDMMVAYKHTQSRAFGEWWLAVSTENAEQELEFNVKEAVFESIGEAFKDFLFTPWTFLWNNRSFVTMAGLGIIAAGAVTTIALSFILGSQVSGAELAARILLSTTLVISTLVLVKAVAKTVKELVHGIKAFLWESVGGFGARLRMNKISIVVRILVSMAVTWGAFFLEWGLGNLGGPGGLTWNSAIWGAVASTITTVLMFVILTALGPLGEIIWAIIGLIDSLVALVCNAFLSEEQKESRAAYWLCGGVTGFVSNAIKWLFYSGTIMVELDPDEEKGPPWYPRLQFTNFNLDDLVHPELGIVEGNAIRYGISLTNTLDLAKVPISDMEVGWEKQFNDHTLRRSSFAYEWQQEEEEIHEHLQMDAIPAEDWHETENIRPFTYETTVDAEQGIPLPEAGVNRHAELILAEAYAVPDQECFGFIFAFDCNIKTYKGTAFYDFGESLVLDVLPATLDEFYDLAEEGAGWTLGWGGDDAFTFRALHDADGDGLSYAEDPDDSRFDKDNDGLADGFELQAGSDPLLPDTDHDGLDDHEEAVLGTDPRTPDTDGDGLLDVEEHRGWKIISGLSSQGVAQYTWVWPDPLNVDADRDGLTDAQERTYGYHPWLPSDPNVLVLSSELGERNAGVVTPFDGYTKPGSQLAYTATVQNKLDNRQAQGLLYTEAPDVLDDRGVPPSSFVLQPLQEKMIAGNVTVGQASASKVYSFTQVAGALISDLQAIAGNAELWLRFDDPANATTYADMSGSQPVHDGRCIGTGCTIVDGGRLGSAIKLAGTGYVHSDAPVSASEYGVSIWFKADQDNPTGVLFTDFSGVQFRVTVFLASGNVCAGDGHDTKCSPAKYNDKQWHHVVHTYGSRAGGQVLYVDGQMVASGPHSTVATTNSTNSNIGGTPYHFTGLTQDMFVGQIDDVRLFNTGLTAGEVQALINQPVLHIDFDAGDRWADTSALRTSVSCTSPLCPAHIASGVAGGAARFSGFTYLRTADSVGLDLNHTPFTLAAWVYPMLRGGSDPRDSFRQGILGRRSGQADGAPSLERIGSQIRFGMGTNAGWKYWTSGNVLTGNTWSHVAVTFETPDNRVKLYVNGVLAGEDSQTFAGLAPASGSKGIDIGRSTNVGTLSIGDGHSDKTGDGGFALCGAAFHDELCMALNGSQILDAEVSCDEDYTIRQTRTFTEGATLRMWEDDDGPTCGSAPNGKDDNINLHYDDTAAATETFNFAMPGDGVDIQREYTGGSEGYFHLNYKNDAIPFYGELDEVEVYNRALDVAAVQRLANSTALALSLDEPPGTTTFQDVSMQGVQASCTSCPTSGVAGRVNQAAWFESAKGNHLALLNNSVNRSANNLTVAAWIKPHTLTSTARVIATALTRSVNGFAFGTSGANLLFTAFGVRDYVLTNAGLQPDRWQHIAAVLDAQNTVSFYVDGVFKNAITSTAAPLPDADDLLLVGATTVIGNATLAEPFNGQIDDLRVYRRPLAAADIKAIYDQAPVFHLRFEEARGATHFADNAQPGVAGSCTGSQCPGSGEEVRGQIGLAADFDGYDDLITVPDSDLLDLTTFTIGAWVFPTSTGLLDYSQELISKLDAGGISSNYDLDIAANTLFPKVSSFCASGSSATSSVPLILNHWNHVVGTYDGKALHIYVNGAESGSTTASGSPCPNTGVLAIGGWVNKIQHSFAGRMDEVAIFRTALSAQQVRDMFTYQAGWVEDRQSFNITVDADIPTVALQVDDKSYVARQPVIIAVEAADSTSGVAEVRLTTPAGTVMAPRCMDVSGNAAWCATVSPTNEGSYALTASATDRVGNAAGSAVRTLYVDDSAPQVTIDGADLQRLPAVVSAAKPQTWLVHLTGAGADRPAGNVSGSGVPADGVRVTLRGANGAVVGDGDQVATLAAGKWSLDYAIPNASASGQYTVTVEAVDQISRLPGLAAGQVARHTGSAQTRVVVDSEAPAVLLDRSNLASGLISPATTLAGAVTDRPVPVEVTWTTSSNGDKAGLTIACTGPAAPYSPYAATAGVFESAQTYTWEGSLPRSGACHVRLATSAAAGGVSGVINICGSQVAAWDGNWAVAKDVAFAADAGACGPMLGVAGVDRGEAAFTPVASGSPFYNETPIAGQILHLPFDDQADSADNLSFRDISGGGHAGNCAGQTCPSTGQIGHVGTSVLFDGVNDVVNVGSQIALANASFSVAFWARRSTTGRLEAVVGQGSPGSSTGLLLGFRANDRFTCAFWNNDLDAPVYADTGWHHWTCTYDAATKSRAIYRDGLQVAQAAATANYQGSGNLYIGAFSSTSYPFSGLMDDVRIFSRALPAAEVKSLYTGAGPLLALDFDKAWAADGAVLPDGSGWGHDGILVAGANDTAGKATTGQVGSGALRFDGVDDYVQVAAEPGLDLSGGQFTEAAWIYSDLADDNYHAILGYQATADLAKRYPGLWVYQRNRIHAGFGDGANWLYFTTGSVLGAGWNHVAATFDGSVYKLYVNGSAVYSTEAMAGHKPYPATQLQVGKVDATLFKGRIDDVRIYPRALPAEELGALYLSGWRQAVLSSHGTGVETSNWSLSVPAGLEGVYRVDLRSADADEHTQVETNRAELWWGAADTLAPRLTLHRTAVDASTYRYTTIAQDFNLTEDNFTSPCGAGAVAARVYYVSPWYLAAAGEDAAHPSRLFQLAADCTLPVGATEQAKACDSAGNCATVGVTGGAEAADAARLPQAAPGVRLTPDLAAAIPLVPTISFATTVLTSTAFYEPRTIAVTGLVTGAPAPVSVQVSIGGMTGTAVLGETAATPPYTTTWRYPWRLPDGQPLPDGSIHAATASVTDLSGQSASTLAALTADVVPPAPVTLTLSANGSTLLPGSTLRTTPAQLKLGWTASTDGSGLAPYRVTWTTRHTETVGVTTGLHVMPLEDQITAGEAQRLSVSVTSRDVMGNVRQQSIEPIYLDSPLTPDYFALPQSDGPDGGVYSDWMDSGCTLMSADRRAAVVRAPQRLYSTWDDRALRLAWTGAIWGNANNLFIYLDTQPGGTEQVFTPVPVAVTGTVVSLPAGLGADALVWVQDAHIASLLRWDGSSWANVAALSGAQYRFAAAQEDGQTDLYLPFDLLGVTPAKPLGLLAFAAEVPITGAGLRLWAALPNVNPVNSAGVNRNAALAGEGVHFSLNHFYRWPALGDEVCPNGSDGSAGGGYGDSDMQFAVIANPPAAAIAGRGGGLFWLPDPAAATAKLLALLQYAYPPVDDGREILYTVHYHNIGTQPLNGAWLALTAVGPQRLLDMSVVLGDVAPGAVGTATFRAIIDRSISPEALAAVKGLVYSTGHGPEGPALDWLWAFYRVDNGAPDSMAITAPELTVGTGSATLAGYAHDESGVATVEIEITAPAGPVTTLTCTVPRPFEGSWQCPWNVTESNGGVLPALGATFGLRMAAIDSLGHRSAWTEPKIILVDAESPWATLDLAASGLYTGAVVRGLGTLFGSGYDVSGIGAVRVCVDGDCGDAHLQSSLVFTTAWSYDVAREGAQDHVRRTIAVTASDRLGNRMPAPLALDVWVDNVSPVLTVTTVISPAHMGAPVDVLRGTVSDGSSQARVTVRLQSPNGEWSRHLASRDGDAWWFNLDAGVPGPYTMWVDAEDMGGNRTTAGPFAVAATCLSAGLEVISVSSEPAVAPPGLLTLSALVHNVGSDAVPAGMPVGFYAGSERIGDALITQSLGAAAAAVVTTNWAVPGAGDYDVRVVLDDADTGLPTLLAMQGAIPLCNTPATTHTVISVHDVPLYPSWNLISPPVEPFVTDIEVVQRPIDGTYDAILGYEQGLRTYQPGRPPEENTLRYMDASHGYWVREAAAPTQQPVDAQEEEPAATLRLVGQAVAADKPLSLAAGWNLVGYLPHQTLPVTDALSSIGGGYAAVLGFEGTGLTYYPDLPAGFNTLFEMAPVGGYWLRASRAITLQYPAAPITTTASAWIAPETVPTPAERLVLIRQAEQGAGVRPTYEWKNFFGEVALPDGSPVPTGTVVLAQDPQGVVCGATVVVDPGRYGLLACYRDDPFTAGDEGAVPGDTIRLVVSTDGIHSDGQEIGAGIWTAHGDRQPVPSQPVYMPLVLIGVAPEHDIWLPLVLQP